MSRPVAVYVRLSQDRDGTKASTARQEADCRALAKARGWKVGPVFRDNGLSAYSGRERPAFEKLLAAIDASQVGGVLAWKVDRLGRRTAEVASFLDRVISSGGIVATCDGLDSSTPVGKSVMQIAGIFAELESSNTASRTSRAKLAAAKDGRPSGGGKRPFGYQSGGMKIAPKEAALIREAAAEILAGGSLRRVVAGWNRRGVKTSERGSWFPASLRRTLMSSRIAGLRSYKGDVIGEAAWPAIVTADEHEQLVAILSDPRRRTSRPGAVRYLLTGHVFCGRCGSVLVAAPVKGKRAYACRSQQRGAGCGGVRILAEPLEAYVAETMLDALDTPELTKMRRASRNDGSAAPITRTLRRDERALERLTTDYYVDGRLGRAEFMVAHDALVKRIEATRAELATLTSSRTVASLPSAGAELRAQWEAADLEWRRALVDAVVERIEVGQSRARGQTDLQRVAIRWDG
jgi:site-specific DNA recombinase